MDKSVESIGDAYGRMERLESGEAPTGSPTCEQYVNILANALARSSSCLLDLATVYSTILRQVSSIVKAVASARDLIRTGDILDARNSLQLVLPEINELSRMILEDSLHRAMLKNACSNLKACIQNGFDYIVKNCPLKAYTYQSDVVEEGATASVSHALFPLREVSCVEEGPLTISSKFILEHLEKHPRSDFAKAVMETYSELAYDDSEDFVVREMYQVMIHERNSIVMNMMIVISIRDSDLGIDNLYVPRSPTNAETRVEACSSGVRRFFDYVRKTEQQVMKYIWPRGHAACRECIHLLPHCSELACANPMCFHCFPTLAHLSYQIVPITSPQHLVSLLPPSQEILRNSSWIRVEKEKV